MSSIGKSSILISLFTILVPFVSLASLFDRDLYFGISNDDDVTKLQEFLTKEGVYSGPVTGNFFSLTQEGVKKFQEREGITPVLGYFGPKTRARANERLSTSPEAVPITSDGRNELIEKLMAQIKALQEQIKSLQEKEVSLGTEPPAPAPSPLPAPQPSPAPTWVSVEGRATSTFPAVETVAFKMGEFTLYNGSSSDILFIRLETILYDEMDSLTNRNRKVQFLVREGTTIGGTLISKTDFTFLDLVPKVGSPHRTVFWLPLDVTVKSREEKTYSVWIEQMKYVRAGMLRVATTKVVTPQDTDIVGAVNLTLTKEPDL